MAKYRCTVCNYVMMKIKRKSSFQIYLKSGFAPFAAHQISLCTPSRGESRESEVKLSTQFQMS